MFTAAALAVALLPGAFFLWGFERRAGRYGIGLRDRSLRVAGGSAFILAIYAAPLYWLYTSHWNQFTAGDLPLWAPTVVSLSYLGLPLLLGWILGIGVERRASWAGRFVPDNRIPTAWDHMFAQEMGGWIRCKLKSGVWVGGAYTSEAGRVTPYASEYPEQHDLYLFPAIKLDALTGSFVYDDHGELVLDAGGVWLHGDDIEIINFVTAEQENEEAVGW